MTDDPEELRTEIDEMATAAATVIAWWVAESKAPPHVIKALKIQRMVDEALGREFGRDEQAKSFHEMLDAKIAEAHRER